MARLSVVTSAAVRPLVAAAFVAVVTSSAFAQSRSPVVDRWVFEPSAAWVYMGRSSNPSSTMISVNGGGATVLSASELDLNRTSGFEAGGTFSNSTWGVDARFLGGFSWDASADKPGVPGVRLGGVNILGVTSLTNNYKSKFNSAEANGLMHIAPQVDLFAGLRYVEISERFAANFNTGVLTVDSTTSSKGFGPQLGVRLRIINAVPQFPLTFGLEGKVGAVHFDNSVATVANGIFASVQDNNSAWSSFAQGGGTVGVMFNKNLTAEVGGRVIYMSHVPSAVTGVTTDAFNVPSSARFVMYGLTAGLRLAF